MRDLAIDEGDEGYIMERVARIPPRSRFEEDFDACIAHLHVKQVSDRIWLVSGPPSWCIKMQTDLRTEEGMRYT